MTDLESIDAPLARAEARVCIERLLDRTTDIRIAEDKHGRADDRHYQYVPTFILRGLTELHLEFTLAEEAGGGPSPEHAITQHQPSGRRLPSH